MTRSLRLCSATSIIYAAMTAPIQAADVHQALRAIVVQSSPESLRDEKAIEPRLAGTFSLLASNAGGAAQATSFVSYNASGVSISSTTDSSRSGQHSAANAQSSALVVLDLPPETTVRMHAVGTGSASAELGTGSLFFNSENGVLNATATYNTPRNGSSTFFAASSGAQSPIGQWVEHSTVDASFSFFYLNSESPLITGDATLDGRVNFDDLVPLAQNYNTSGSGVLWSQGDFNFDHTVNFDDLVPLAQNYNTGEPLPATLAGYGAFATDWALAQSLVPEPCLIVSVATLTPVLALRRRV